MSSTLLKCELEERPSQGHALVLAGALTSTTANTFSLKARKGLSKAKGTLTLDLNALEDIDSAGAAAILSLWRHAQEMKLKLVVEGASEDIQDRLDHFVVDDHSDKDVNKPNPGVFERLGDWGLNAWDIAISLLLMASDTTAEAFIGALKPRKLRWGEFTLQMARIGSNALGTVGLITFLVGLTLAFQSAHQLRQFGAAMFVADLTAVAMFREMGPLMTAILVAGRSGSSIAAEIATMKVSEELDALEVMGIPFIRFLGLPRLLAMIVVMPMLVIMANLIGILGGLFVGVLYLDLSVLPYLSASLDALGPKDLTMSIVKALTFGWGIAIIALNQGVSVQGGAQEVGTATTSSVVQSLFFIILMDAAFSILFYVVLE